MNSLPSVAAPRTRPPSITVPTLGEKSPGTPPTAAGAGFADMDDETDDGLDSGGEDVIFALPCVDVTVEEQKKKSTPVFGFQRSKKKGNDPFDFVERLPEDPEYEEMGETARLWKIFLQERGKVDADKVQNWKDALDVLLVFAGLFSAVVSSFVLQTYQTPQVDSVQIIALLVVELVGLQRAADPNTVPATDITPLTDFRPARSAVWVNGMWFISLVLSLTAAMIAGLTKQWVNEYLDSAQVGTPRTLSRNRQFRAVQLEAWHVPVIIGLLPVLMHVSLGLFLAGLIVFLFTLSTPLAVAISLVAAGILATYFATNILPLYNPSCPYKTPLTNYIYWVYRYLCHLEFPRRWLAYLHVITTQSKTLYTMPASLKDAEAQLVSQDTESLDSQVAMWLYNVSTNSSIQRCVLEALSNIPLTSVDLILEAISNIPSSHADFAKRRIAFFENVMQGFLRLTAEESVSAYLRLRRTLLRFAPVSEVHRGYIPPGLDRDGESLPALLNLSTPSRAAAFLSREIVSSTERHDVVVWTQILWHALYTGHDWLDIGVPKSTVWEAMMDLVCGVHHCERCAHRSDSPGHVYRIALTDKRDIMSAYEGLELAVLEPPPSEGFSTTQAITFRDAVKWFLQPSFCELVLRFHSSTAYAFDIPSDIRLQLDLIQSPVTQHTSVLFEPYTPAAQIIISIQRCVGLHEPNDTHIQHEKIPHTIFDVMKYVIGSSECHLTLQDMRSMVRTFFRTVLIAPTLARKYRAWMTRDLAEIILQPIFHRFFASGFYVLIAPALSEALQVAVRTRCPFLLPEIYRRLRVNDWLRILPESFDLLPKLQVHDDRHIPFLVAAFLQGLAVLRSMDHNEYTQTIAYIRQPLHARELGQVLVLSDSESRRKLQTLFNILPPGLRSACLHDITAFLKTSAAREILEWRMTHCEYGTTAGGPWKVVVFGLEVFVMGTANSR